MDSITDEQSEGGGPSRRDVLRRSAILGGALVWTVPTVQTIAGAAFAAGTTCDAELQTNINGNVTCYRFRPTDPCCECLATNRGGPLGDLAAIVICSSNGSCQFEPGFPAPGPCPAP